MIKCQYLNAELVCFFVLLFLLDGKVTREWLIATKRKCEIKKGNTFFALQLHKESNETLGI